MTNSHLLILETSLSILISFSLVALATKLKGSQFFTGILVLIYVFFISTRNIDYNSDTLMYYCAHFKNNLTIFESFVKRLEPTHWFIANSVADFNHWLAVSGFIYTLLIVFLLFKANFYFFSLILGISLPIMSSSFRLGLSYAVFGVLTYVFRKKIKTFIFPVIATTSLFHSMYVFLFLCLNLLTIGLLPIAITVLAKMDNRIYERIGFIAPLTDGKLQGLKLFFFSLCISGINFLEFRKKSTKLSNFFSLAFGLTIILIVSNTLSSLFIRIIPPIAIYWLARYTEISRLNNFDSRKKNTLSIAAAIITAVAILLQWTFVLKGNYFFWLKEIDINLCLM